jgi:hypothetical protein
MDFFLKILSYLKKYMLPPLIGNITDLLRKSLREAF